MFETMYALEITGLEKSYDNGFKALKGIDFSVKQGEFFALLGPNGAGKSTSIGIISSLVRKTKGEVKIFGYDINSESEMAKRYVGLVPQEFNFNSFDSPLNILVQQAGYYGIRRSEAVPRAERLLKQLDLWSKKDVSSRLMSGGMKRRLMIARALIHEPKLLILDEPTAGVDIEIRRSMWEFLRQINQEGTAIILTTHYLEEAEALCERVAIINHGQIVENGKVEDLLSQAMSETFVLDVERGDIASLSLEGYRVTESYNDRLEIEVPKGLSINGLFEQLSVKGVSISSMRNKSNRLEEFFLRLVASQKEASV